MGCCNSKKAADTKGSGDGKKTADKAAEKGPSTTKNPVTIKIDDKPLIPSGAESAASTTAMTSQLGSQVPSAIYTQDNPASTQASNVGVSPAISVTSPESEKRAASAVPVATGSDSAADKSSHVSNTGVDAGPPPAAEPSRSRRGSAIEQAITREPSAVPVQSEAAADE